MRVLAIIAITCLLSSTLAVRPISVAKAKRDLARAELALAKLTKVEPSFLKEDSVNFSISSAKTDVIGDWKTERYEGVATKTGFRNVRGDTEVFFDFWVMDNKANGKRDLRFFVEGQAKPWDFDPFMDKAFFYKVKA